MYIKKFNSIWFKMRKIDNLIANEKKDISSIEINKSCSVTFQAS